MITEGYGDTAELKKLYKASFTEDTTEDVDYVFEKILSSSVPLVMQEDGTVNSMLFLIDCSFCVGSNTLPFYYLYAACTAPKIRGNGFMKDLIERAKQFAVRNGKAGICLYPANNNLYSYYSRFGFLPLIKSGKIDFDGVIQSTTPFKITLSEYLNISEEILKANGTPFISFNGKFLKNSLVGYSFYSISTDESKAVCAVDRDSKTIMGAHFTDEKSAKLLLSAVATKEKAVNKCVKCPPYEKTVKFDSGMIWTEQSHVLNTFMEFVFN